MRTKEARRIRNEGLKRAKKNGHVVAIICEGEAFSAYGCLNCDDLMDFWDSPAGMNGPMAHQVCAGGVRPSFIKNIFSYFSKFFSPRREVMDDVNDEQLEIGFVKLQLYDRMINTCGQTITLFADMLTRHSADKIKLNSKDLNVIESIINEVNEIFLLEKDIQLKMDVELLKGSFLVDDVLN